LKNYFVEYCRFIGTLVIVSHHVIFLTPDYSRPYFFGGWIFVEFFFLLTGYLTTAHFDKEPITDVNQIFTYPLRKIKRLMPYAVCGILLSYAVANCRPGLGLYQRIKLLIDIPLNALLLYPSFEGSAINVFNGQLWYVSEILYVLPLVILLLIKCKKVYQYYICWIVPILAYAISLHLYGTIPNVGFIASLNRGIGGLMLGSAVYYLVCFLKSSYPIARRKRVFTVIGQLCLLFIALSQIWWSYWDASVEAIFLVIVLIASAFLSEGAFFHSEGCKKLCDHLGRLSMPIFCIHTAVMEFIQLLFPQLSLRIKFGISVFTILICAEILMKCFDSFRHARKNRPDSMVL